MELFGFGFSGPEMVVIALVLLLVVGPTHLVEASRHIARAIAWLRAQSARMRETSAPDRVAAQLGDIDWSEWDPRSLDPRVLIREAVREEMEAWKAELAAAPARPARSPTDADPHTASDIDPGAATPAPTPGPHPAPKDPT